MTTDVETLRMYMRGALIFAAIGCTAWPVLYSFSPWRSRPIGKLLMLQAVVIAAVFDISVIFSFWAPQSISLIFWTNMILLLGIGITMWIQTISVAVMQYSKNRGPIMQVMLTGVVYDRMKFVAQILLPALGALYFALAQIWHLPKAEEVGGTILAIDTFLGVLLGLSSKTYNATEAKYDGELVLIPSDEGTEMRLSRVDISALETKKEITLKINR